MSTLYNIWTDGSYRQAHGVVGAGWLISRPDGQKEEGSYALRSLPTNARPHGSDFSEILAVSKALREIPPNSAVGLHIDCANLIQWLNAKALSPKLSGIGIISEEFGNAMHGIGQAKSIEIIKVGGKNQGLARAHELSRIASNKVMPR